MLLHGDFTVLITSNTSQLDVLGQPTHLSPKLLTSRFAHGHHFLVPRRMMRSRFWLLGRKVWNPTAKWNRTRCLQQVSPHCKMFENGLEQQRIKTRETHDENDEKAKPHLQNANPTGVWQFIFKEALSNLNSSWPEQGAWSCPTTPSLSLGSDSIFITCFRIWNAFLAECFLFESGVELVSRCLGVVACQWAPKESDLVPRESPDSARNAFLEVTLRPTSDCRISNDINNMLASWAPKDPMASLDHSRVCQKKHKHNFTHYS